MEERKGTKEARAAAGVAAADGGAAGDVGGSAGLLLEHPCAALEFERRGGWESVVPCEAAPGRYLDWFEDSKAGNRALAAQLGRILKRKARL